MTFLDRCKCAPAFTRRLRERAAHRIHNITDTQALRFPITNPSWAAVRVTVKKSEARIKAMVPQSFKRAGVVAVIAGIIIVVSGVTSGSILLKGLRSEERRVG